GELAEALFNVLHEVSKRLRRAGPGREVIVFDGLDELAHGTDLHFFPSALPPGVFFVVLSRPCDLMGSLRQRVQAQQRTFELPGLSEVEVRPLYDLAQVRLSEAERRQLVGAGQGWPLYHRRVIDSLRLNPCLQDVPAGLEGLYRLAVEHA